MKPELIVAEKVFLNRSIFREADRHYASAVEQVANATQTIVDSHCNKITDEVNKIKAQIKAQIADTLKSAVEGDDSKDEKATIGVSDLVSRLSLVECENKKLRDIIKNMESRLDTIEGQSAKKTTASSPSASPAPVSAPAPAQASITETATPVKVVTASSTPVPASVPVAAETTAKKSGKGKNKKNKNKDKKGSPQPEPVKAAVAPVPVPAPVVPATKQDDDDFDLFDSDEEEEDSEEKKRITEERLAAYAAKKSKKPTVVAKSSILLDIKPWDDETNMAELEAKVRTISMDGLVWGQSKLIPVAFGVKKCQIGCVVEDDKVSTEVLEEEILAFEDYCQSVDIVSFNKI